MSSNLVYDGVTISSNLTLTAKTVANTYTLTLASDGSGTEKVRYIRDYLDGNTKNINEHWV